MNPTHYTNAGTAIYEPSQAEYDSILEDAAQSLGMTVSQFTEKYEAGVLDDADPAVSELAALLRLGQNGRRVST